MEALLVVQIMHARLNVCQFTAVKNDSCTSCTARIIQLYLCLRTDCASQMKVEPWRTKFSVLMARERGRIGADAALGDVSKRLWAHAFDEMDDGPAR